LVNAGLLQSTSKSESTIVSTPTKEPTPSPEDDAELQTCATREYRTAILAETVKLTTADLARYVTLPSIKYILKFPLQGKISGCRLLVRSPRFAM